MYRQIDCALLALPAFEPWLKKVAAEHRTAPVQFHICPLNADSDWSGSVLPATTYETPASQALLRCAPALLRHDVCLLPVMPASLAWTRVALAIARDHLPVPLVLWARGLSAPALRDLLALGAADFMLESAGVEELKVRLTQCVARRPREMAAAAFEHGAGLRPGRPAPAAEVFARTLQSLSAPEPADDSYRATRAQVLADFERDYVTNMLMRHRGNVTHAARAGKQDRRAFWQLMRKYQILSADYRNDGR